MPAKRTVITFTARINLKPHTMKRPDIPAALSFDSRGINDASREYAPRLFSITLGRTNDPQMQALGHAFAAVPALLEALETLLARSQKHLPQNADNNGLTNCDAIAKARSALTAAGYQF